MGLDEDLTEGLLSDARALLERGEAEEALALLNRGLVERPDEPRLLQLAGQCHLTLGRADSVGVFERLAEVRPGDPDVWRDLGDALAAEGQMAAAAHAFQRLVDLDGGDLQARIDLSYALYQEGRPTEAIALLDAVLAEAPENPIALEGLSEMLQRSGDSGRQLETALRLASTDPDNVGYLLTVAELHLTLANFADAALAFARLRMIDRAEGHELYACHGEIEALIQLSHWRRALDVAIEAARADRGHVTTDLLVYISAKLFGETSHRALEWSELSDALAAERVAHRHLHSEEIR